MDPIDAILAVLTLRVIHIVREDHSIKDDKKAIEGKK